MRSVWPGRRIDNGDMGKTASVMWPRMCHSICPRSKSAKPPGLRRLLHLPEPLAKPIFRVRLVDYASPRPYLALGSVPVPQTAGG